MPRPPPAIGTAMRAQCDSSGFSRQGNRTLTRPSPSGSLFCATIADRDAADDAGLARAGARFEQHVGQ